jgi:hypothetical protein
VAFLFTKPDPARRNFVRERLGEAAPGMEAAVAALAEVDGILASLRWGDVAAVATDDPQLCRAAKRAAHSHDELRRLLRRYSENIAAIVALTSERQS